MARSRGIRVIRAQSQKEAQVNTQDSGGPNTVLKVDNKSGEV